MNKREFLLLIDELFEETLGTFNGSEQLHNLEAWDSMTVLGFIALLDEKFNIVVSGDSISNCRTINDLINLAGTAVTE